MIVEWCQRRGILHGAVWASVWGNMSITLLGHVGALCAVIALWTLTGNQGPGIIDKDGDSAVDVRIWWLLQEVADLFCSVQ